MADVRLVCIDCGCSFTVTAGEQTSRLAWQLPLRCVECRKSNRAVRAADGVFDDGTDVILSCVNCGHTFVFGGRDKAFFAARGYKLPKRCRPCRGVLRALDEIHATSPTDDAGSDDGR